MSDRDWFAFTCDIIIVAGFCFLVSALIRVVVMLWL